MKLTSREARHSKVTAEWFTPMWLIGASRRALDWIDLDPASCEEANARVGARRFYSQEENGLSQSWYGRVFLNPPGGLVREFWQKLLQEYEAGHTTACVWIGFSLEQLQTLQRFDRSPLSFPTCIPKQRVRFEESAAAREARRARCLAEGRRFTEAVSPTHANYITLVGGTREQCERFRDVFSDCGALI